MNFENGKGALFRNDHREPNSNQPSFRGSIVLADVEYQLSGWVREAKSGQKYLSLAARVKEATDSKPAAPREDFHNDEIGF
jgi:hypothetical protein